MLSLWLFHVQLMRSSNDLQSLSPHPRALFQIIHPPRHTSNPRTSLRLMISIYTYFRKNI